LATLFLQGNKNEELNFMGNNHGYAPQSKLWKEVPQQAAGSSTIHCAGLFNLSNSATLRPACAGFHFRNWSFNNKSTITIHLTALFILLIFIGFPGRSMSAEQAVGKQKVNKEVKQQENPYANAEITIKIISSINHTFGYDILLNGRPLVHQPNIPGLPGNKGFATEGRAQKVAEFVVRKIRKNKMPPTVTIEDLNSMGVLK
jgi:hypothetical protein